MFACTHAVVCFSAPRKYYNHTKVINFIKKVSQVYFLYGRGWTKCGSYKRHAVTFWHLYVPSRGSKSCKTTLPLLMVSQITSTKMRFITPYQPSLPTFTSIQKHPCKYRVIPKECPPHSIEIIAFFLILPHFVGYQFIEQTNLSQG